MNLLSLVLSSIVQAAAALALAALAWGLHRGRCALRRRPGEPFRRWCGLVAPSCPLRTIGLLALLFGLYGALAFIAARHLMPDFDILASSSMAHVARLPGLPSFLLGAFVYAFLQTGFAEELLFRGVIARRLVRWLGFHAGNVLQALLFTGIHHAVLASDQRELPLGAHIYVFLIAFPVSWAGVWYNERRAGGAIAGSWAMHGGANMAVMLMARAGYGA